jgi:hypothetical protein
MTTLRSTPPSAIGGWAVTATCPRCSGALGHLAGGNPTPWFARAVAECLRCGHRYCVQVTISDASHELGKRRKTPHRPDCPCPPCHWRRRSEEVA